MKSRGKTRTQFLDDKEKARRGGIKDSKRTPIQLQMRFGIHFCDSDFINTFYPILETIGRINFTPTKEQIALIYNELVKGMYIAFQNCFECKGDFDKTKEYLTITSDRVYIGEEVKEASESGRSLYVYDYGEVYYLEA